MCQPAAQTACSVVVCPIPFTRALLTANGTSWLNTTNATFWRTNLSSWSSSDCRVSLLTSTQIQRRKNMADVLKAIIAHWCWHRCKDKLHWCFSCCVILIPGRISAGWDSSTFPRTTWQWTSKGIWLLEQHKELHALHTYVEVFVFFPAMCQVLLGERQAAGICRQSFSCDSYRALRWH